MARYCRLLIVLFLVLLPGAALAQGEHGGHDPTADVAFDQRLGAELPLDLEFVDDAGQPVTLGNYFGTKPVVLALGYYQCPMLCSLVRNGMVSSLEQVRLNVGSDFDVVNVSIDPQETAMNAANTKAAIVSRYNRPGSEAGWHFLTGSQDNIQQLADAVGFKYFYDETIDQYAHAAGIMVVTPEGQLARYFYGIDYNSSDLRLGLVEASGNEIGTPVDQLLLLCYHYDPVSGKYTGMIMTLVRTAGVITMLGIGALVWLLSRGGGQTGAPRGPAPAAS